MVPSGVIEEIRERINLVRLIGEVVPLRRSGRNFVGLCPFHEEKSPSFTVSEQKQLFHCFGCGVGGTAFTFFMKYHHMTFPETLQELARVSGIDLTKYQTETDGPESRRKEERKRLVKVLSYAKDKYHRALMESSVGQDARQYLVSRGLGKETIKKVGLGYAPQGWRTLVAAMERDHVSLEDANKAGLLGRQKEGGGYYDLFRSRLLFPITNTEGLTVGFGGRVLGSELPKYLNSSQTLVFDKGKLLFGLSEAEPAIRREKRVIVVEGYFDQVILMQEGLQHVVATLGTALTQDHALLLKRYCDEVIVIFDGDEAGRKATWRSMKPLLSEGLRAKVVLLPEGFDPDNFVRTNGKGEILSLVTNADPMLHVYVDQHFKKESEVSRKARALEELADLIATTKNVYLRESIVEEVSQLTGLEKDILRGEKKATFVGPRSVKKMISEAKPAMSAEELLLLALAANIAAARQHLLESDVLLLFSSENMQEYVRNWLAKIDPFQEEESPISAYVDAWEDEESRSLIARTFMDSTLDYTDSWKQVFGDCVRKLRRKELTRLTQQVAIQEAQGNAQAVLELSVKVQELKQMDQKGNAILMDQKFEGRNA